MIIEIHYNDKSMHKQEYLEGVNFIDMMLENDTEELKEGNRINSIVLRHKMNDEYPCVTCGIINSYGFNEDYFLLCTSCGGEASNSAVNSGLFNSGYK